MTPKGIDFISCLNIAGPGIWAAWYIPRLLVKLAPTGVDLSFLEIAGPGHAQC